MEVLFINSGLLGQRIFAGFVEGAFVGEQHGMSASQIVVSEGLSLGERVQRRLLCTRLWPDAAGVKNFDRFRYRAELNAGLVAARRMRRLERAGHRFDVLHFHRQATAYASLARMRATPSVVSIDCTAGYLMQTAATPAEARSYLPNQRRDGAVFAAARLIISTSRWAAQALRREYPRCDTALEVMPTPVLLERFPPGWAAERQARASAQPGYRPRVLFVGGDFTRKGGHDLVAAWRQKRFGERARLDLITHSSLPAEIEGDGIRVHHGVTAYSPEWLELWRQADVFALPTRDEAFGQVFQEAGAAGLPALATDLTALPEIVLHEQSGLLVPPGDRLALAAALERLLSSAGVRREMGERARRHIEQTADPEAYRLRLAAMLRRLGEGR
jgi:glycosyltransferase involved in cell wall biosynthesis